MNIEKSLDLLVVLVFSMIPQIGVIGLKAKKLLISFCIGEVYHSQNTILNLFNQKTKLIC